MDPNQLRNAADAMANMSDEQRNSMSAMFANMDPNMIANMSKSMGMPAMSATQIAEVRAQHAIPLPPTHTHPPHTPPGARAAVSLPRCSASIGVTEAQTGRSLQAGLGCPPPPKNPTRTAHAQRLVSVLPYVPSLAQPAAHARARTLCRPRGRWVTARSTWGTRRGRRGRLRTTRPC